MEYLVDALNLQEGCAGGFEVRIQFENGAQDLIAGAILKMHWQGLVEIISRFEGVRSRLNVHPGKDLVFPSGIPCSWKLPPLEGSAASRTGMISLPSLLPTRRRMVSAPFTAQ